MRERILAIFDRAEELRLRLGQGVIVVAGGDPADGVCLAFGYGLGLGVLVGLLSVALFC